MTMDQSRISVSDHSDCRTGQQNRAALPFACLPHAQRQDKQTLRRAGVGQLSGVGSGQNELQHRRYAFGRYRFAKQVALSL